MKAGYGRAMTPGLTAVPLVADAIGWLLLLGLTPALSRQLQTWSLENVLLLAAVYLLFCGGVYLLRQAEAGPSRGRLLRLPGWLWRRPLQATLGVLFALAMMLAFTHQLGYLEIIPLVDLRKMGSGEAAAFLGLAPGAWLAFSLFYSLMLVSSFAPTVPPQAPRYPWLLLAALLTAHLMLLLFVAEGRVLLAEWGLNGQGRLFLPALAVLLLLLGPPRLWYLALRPQLGPLISFGVLLLTAAYLLSLGSGL